MSSLLSAVTGPTDETTANRGTEQPGAATTDGSDGSGGSRRRTLALAAAGLGAAYLVRRRRASQRAADQETDATSAGERDASETADGSRGSGIRGRLVRTVAGFAASILVRRAIRRWRAR
ncbi:hypothetical protein [Halobacterium jilantaiense]|uniref:MYXO-CTERM domain-containing protein n=1 Tax=Halobacterium jilantaiense TaxID=355548 RepID=A0A1I0ML90_9EURY|nr:hypothetical protein [Halobacterium jilantaiense]SEV88721.1 MYXO-CTERM domain-containing protein [Halobacterium jilantaiense]